MLSRKFQSASIFSITKRFTPITTSTTVPFIFTSQMPISTVEDVNRNSSAYDFVVLDSKKAEFDLNQLRGKPTLFVNVASKCGLTKDSYASLVTLYDRHKEKGFTVLGFPCNQFAGQEPGSEQEIVSFACERFSANFPILAKVDVNGNNASPLWQWLKKTKPGFLGTEGIKWNFTSFLVDKDGKVIERYSPGVKVEDVEKNLLPLLQETEQQQSSSSSAESKSTSKL